ncbi:MAG: GMC family oxidoreductase [Alphaproteobacteria bacterium]|nr:GMC family oxidoreductase [Alphaproteobacteria bacterium]
MVTKLNEVDAVVIGVGMTGAMIAKEFTLAGLTVVGLERGPDRRPREESVLPRIRDELKYVQRLELMQDNSIDTVTFRNNSEQTALPIRRWGAFLPGEGVGGTLNHWGGMHWRYLPTDFRIRSTITERYGAGAIPGDMTIADWPVSYDELEPYYDKFDKMCGVAGKAGNLRGQKIAGGNIFEGARSDEYPTPALKPSGGAVLFTQACNNLGHHPFPAPFGAASQPYKNIYGIQLGACEYCGFCGRNSCEANSKVTAPTHIMPALRDEAKFTLRTNAFVSKLVYDRQAKKVTSVLYTDMNTGEEYEQPAGIVILSGYVFTNSNMLFHSGIGEPYDARTGRGVVGKNYCYQFEATATAFFEDKNLNPFMGSPGDRAVIDDFNGENFDHSGLDFLGGGYIRGGSGAEPPIGGRAVPADVPSWGSEWKKETVRWYYHAVEFQNQGSVYANRANYLDVDPIYKDALGRPLIRLTYNATKNDHAMSRYMLTKIDAIIKEMNPTHYELHPRPLNFTIVPYQSTHNTGGTMMGTTPANSVVNRYQQSWAAHNLFIMGASTFPQQHGYNPTGTVGALAYFASDKIVKDYVKNPGPLVQA